FQPLPFSVQPKFPIRCLACVGGLLCGCKRFLVANFHILAGRFQHDAVKCLQPITNAPSVKMFQPLSPKRGCRCPLWVKSDIAVQSLCPLTPKSGYSAMQNKCPLWANSGHWHGSGWSWRGFNFDKCLRCFTRRAFVIKFH